MLFRTLICIGMVATFIFSTEAFAAKVTKVKGRKVLIDLEDTVASKGDYFFVLRKNGKRSGILKISRVRRGKAIGILGKGKARAGYTLKLRRAKKGDRRSRPMKKASAAPETSFSEAYWGLLFGTNATNMSIDLGTTGTAELSGSGFSAKGLIDYAIFNKFWFRGLFGIETVNASGDTNATCTGDAQECEVEIMYLTFDLCGRYLFTLSSFRPFIGGCFDLFFPMTKESTALEDSSITNTSVMAAVLGFDWFVSKTFSIPVSVEYGLFPSSEQVTADMIAARLGFAVSF